MRLVLIALLVTGCGAFGQRSGAAGHGSGYRGPRGSVSAGRYGAPPTVGHVHVGAGVVPYPVYYGGYYYYYDPSLFAGGYTQPPASGDNGYYDPGYNAGYADDGGPNGAPGQSPVVIINQSFRPDTANPVVRDYSNTPLPPPGGAREVLPDDQPTIYLIALKDHTIFPAVAYWVDGDTLNYITTEGSQNRASMALVDRDFSIQLNNERHVEFKLPAPR